MVNGRSNVSSNVNDMHIILLKCKEISSKMSTKGERVVKKVQKLVILVQMDRVL